MPPTMVEFNITPGMVVPAHLRTDPIAHGNLVLQSHAKLEKALHRWENELNVSRNRRAAQYYSEWDNVPHAKKMLQQGRAILERAERSQAEHSLAYKWTAREEFHLVHHDCVPNWNGVKFLGGEGPAVRVAPEFDTWEAFQKFSGKVGVLKRPHLPGTGWVFLSGGMCVCYRVHATLESRVSDTCQSVCVSECGGSISQAFWVEVVCTRVNSLSCAGHYCTNSAITRQTTNLGFHMMEDRRMLCRGNQQVSSFQKLRCNRARLRLQAISEH
jgi:hypothetical protein